MSDEGIPSHEQVQDQLDRILASPSFRTTGRLSDFLRFVVQETLAGRQHKIKGYTVATCVFGRPDSFDAKADPVVRIQAGRLRRRLAEYYSKEGATDPIRIELPKGIYVPVFLRAGGPVILRPVRRRGSGARQVRGSKDRPLRCCRSCTSVTSPM